MVTIKFEDGEVIEEVDATNFGYNIGKYGNMTVVLVGENPEEMISVHHNVRSAWKSGPAPTTAIDISSLPKKAK